MNFRKHFELNGRHAILSPSSWRWINDDPESLVKRLCSQYLAPIGTILHSIAYKHIKHRIKLNKYDKKNVMLELVDQGVPAYVIDTINFDVMYDNFMRYVNDCIAFKMTPEVVLRYSDNFFGTSDAIRYDEDIRFLRIHDYKSGVAKANMDQLLAYAGIFCAEYNVDPEKINVELRIYQLGDIVVHNPEADELQNVVDNIKRGNNDIIYFIKEI